VTDGGTVITRRADEDAAGSRSSKSIDDYTSIYVGEVELTGNLVPKDAPEYSVPVRPDDLTTGDLWPSVYDGARYSFSMGGDAWWHNPQTKKRHSVAGGLPKTVVAGLQRLKPEGGSFRVTPWGDVITLVRSPATQTVKDQFSDLPRVVRNIIKLRRERADLQMIPVYVARLDTLPLDVTEPTSITDRLSAEEQEALEGWAASLGSTTPTSVDSHTTTRSNESPGDPTDATTQEVSEAGSRDDDGGSGDDDLPIDDPVAWLNDDMDKTEERINER
jgi:hypothetical protein